MQIRQYVWLDHRIQSIWIQVIAALEQFLVLVKIANAWELVDTFTVHQRYLRNKHLME